MIVKTKYSAKIVFFIVVLVFYSGIGVVILRVLNSCRSVVSCMQKRVNSLAVLLGFG